MTSLAALLTNIPSAVPRKEQQVSDTNKGGSKPESSQAANSRKGKPSTTNVKHGVQPPQPPQQGKYAQFEQLLLELRDSVPGTKIPLHLYTPEHVANIVTPEFVQWALERDYPKFEASHQGVRVRPAKESTLAGMRASYMKLISTYCSER
jgi:hypothetical protein